MLKRRAEISREADFSVCVVAIRGEKGANLLVRQVKFSKVEFLQEGQFQAAGFLEADFPNGAVFLRFLVVVFLYVFFVGLTQNFLDKFNMKEACLWYKSAVVA